MKFEQFSYLDAEFGQLSRILEVVNASHTGAINALYTPDVVSGMASSGLKLIDELRFECYGDDEVETYLAEAADQLSEFIDSVRSPSSEVAQIFSRLARFRGQPFSSRMHDDDMSNLYLTSVEHLGVKLNNSDAKWIFYSYDS